MEQLHALDQQLRQSSKEKDLTDKKMARMEQAKKLEVEELTQQLNSIQGNTRTELKQKDYKINELMEELANATLLLNERNAEFDQLKTAADELEALREMKDDVERKEKQQAAIIDSQAKKLDELEKSYKEEQLLRKRYWNMMEDMKGKIRVYCRVRPLIDHEKRKGQNFVIHIADELTLAHPWKDEKKMREYAFDRIFGPEGSQDSVFQDTRHLV